jgi:hypothetical protein
VTVRSRTRSSWVRRTWRRLGLRTTAGIDLDGFLARYGVDLLAANDTLVARLVDEVRLVVRADPEDRPVS